MSSRKKFGTIVGRGHSMRSLFLFLTTAAAVAAISARAQTGKIDTLEVGPCPVLTYGAFFKQISLDTDHPEIDRIEGFQNVWGHAYRLVVEVKRRAPPLADESGTSARLVEVLSERSVERHRQCILRLEPNMYLGPGEDVPAIEQEDDSTFLYLKSVYLSVPAVHMERVERICRKKESRVGVFDFAGRLNALRLIGFSAP